MAQVRYWAAARQRAGVTEEHCTTGPLSSVLAAIGSRHEMAELLGRCVLLLDGEQVRHGDDRTVTDSSLLEILPPYAGGAR